MGKYKIYIEKGTQNSNIASDPGTIIAPDQTDIPSSGTVNIYLKGCQTLVSNRKVITVNSSLLKNLNLQVKSEDAKPGIQSKLPAGIQQHWPSNSQNNLTYIGTTTQLNTGDTNFGKFANL